MNLRDRVESAIRAWNAYEIGRGAGSIIDYDIYPVADEVTPALNRVAALRELVSLATEAEESGSKVLAERIRADIAYLRTLLGTRPDLNEYVLSTQGCPVAGWPAEYVESVGSRAREALNVIDIGWGPQTTRDLEESEGKLDVADAGDAIRHAAGELESRVRTLTGATAEFTLTVENTNVDEYWAYWVDGSGHDVRLRLNLRQARFTEVRARQFALHEVLGHGLQSANLAGRAESEEVPWVRLLSVHTPSQVMLEGLAQVLPLFAVPDDVALAARVRLDHYLELVRAELHIAINDGAAIDACVRHAQQRVPFWSEEQIADELTDRGQNSLLRSYLWSYAAGIDWFAALAKADATTAGKVLHAAYRAPHSPSDLQELWPAGPAIGGPGNPVRLR